MFGGRIYTERKLGLVTDKIRFESPTQISWQDVETYKKRVLLRLARHDQISSQ